MSIHSKRLSGCRAVLIVLALAGATISLAAQSPPTRDDQSWTATSEARSANSNPSRTTESYAKSDNRTVDKKTVEVLGPDGEYQPYIETETETIEDSPTLTRSVTRTYNPDPNGDRQLTQVTDSETQNSADGTARTVQTTSKPNSDGNLKVVEREITTTTKGVASQDSQTTVYLPDVNGTLVPNLQVNQQEERSASGETDVKSTTWLPDANGNWQVYESHEKRVEGNGLNRTTDEHVFRRDYAGKLTPVSEVITKDTNVNDQRSITTETYSVDVPGSARDGTLHSLQSSTTVQTTEPDQVITEQSVAQHDSAEKGLDTLVNTKDVVIKSSSGTKEAITVTERFPDGSPSVVTIEMRNSSQH